MDTNHTTRFRDTYVGQRRMFVRNGSCHCYPRNEVTRDAVCQLEWAYAKLAEPCVTFENGRTSHECANELVERYEDRLIDHLQMTVVCS